MFSTVGHQRVVLEIKQPASGSEYQPENGLQEDSPKNSEDSQRPELNYSLWPEEDLLEECIALCIGDYASRDANTSFTQRACRTRLCSTWLEYGGKETIIGQILRYRDNSTS